MQVREAGDRLPQAAPLDSGRVLGPAPGAVNGRGRGRAARRVDSQGCPTTTAVSRRARPRLRRR